MILEDMIRQGDVCFVNFDPSVGHEYKGRRPALVIQSDARMSKSELITIMPLTSALRNRVEEDIYIKKDAVNCLFANSILKVNHVMSFDYCRFIKKIGKADEATMKRVKDYLKEHFGI